MERLNVGGASVRQLIVDELKCDVFVYGRDEPGAAEAVRATFKKQLASVYLGPQVEADVMLATIKLSPRYAELLASCERSNLLHPGTLSGLWWTQKAFELMQSHEKMVEKRYTHVVLIRPDIETFAPMPPLALFGKRGLYLPTRTTWGGLPQSMVVCRREDCGPMSHLFSLLRNGTVVGAMLKKQLLNSQRHCQAVEIFVHNAMVALDVRINFFSIVYAILCSPKACLDGDLCYAGKNVCKPGQKYKYDRGPPDWHETEVARRNAARIRRKGWRESEMLYNSPWNRTNMRRVWDAGLPFPPGLWGDYNALHPPPPFSPLDPF